MTLYEAAGERGHGSSTEAREADFTSGRTSERQASALGEVRSRGRKGATWREVAEARGWHHGQTSSALSILHRRGLIARVNETRNHCGVYVVPEHVGSRETILQGRRWDAQALARDVPLDTLREALRIATTPPPNERTPDERPAHTGHEYSGGFARASALAGGDPDWMNATGGYEVDDPKHPDYRDRLFDTVDDLD